MRKRKETRGRPRLPESQKKKFLNFSVPARIWSKIRRVDGNRSEFIGIVLDKVPEDWITAFNAQPTRFQRSGSKIL